MARLALFRSMHNVRPGERHQPSRVVTLDAAAVAYLRLCDVEPGIAWALDRLTEVRRRMESEARLLHSYATDAERAQGEADLHARVAERLRNDARHRAVQTFVELAREAEQTAKTLVYDEA
ncbi:MAG: hypothetical protein ACXVEE_02955 [Polyangiales bacterium]